MKIGKELKIGVFAIIVIALVYWGINFLKGVDVLSANRTYYAYYDESQSIENSSPIMVKGIKVGTIVNVDMADLNSKVKVTLSINKKYQIPENSVALITSQSLIGGKCIVLEIGDSKNIVEPQGVIEGKIDNNMSEQIDEVKTTVTNVVADLTTTLESLNKLLNEENTTNLGYTFKNLSEISANLNKIIEKDGEKLGVMIENLEGITSEFKEAAPSLKSSIQNLDTISNDIKEANVGELLNNAKTSLASLNTTLEALNSTEGTMGKFMNDPELYNSLQSVSSNLDKLFIDFKENPKRYVHFSVFGGKDKSKKK